MESRRDTVFQVGGDGLDSAAFLAGVRRLVVGNAQLDSVVSAAMVRHLDFLLASEGSGDGDARIDERASQIDAGLRNVLALASRGHSSPDTAAFKALISTGERARRPESNDRQRVQPPARNPARAPQQPPPPPQNPAPPEPGNPVAESQPQKPKSRFRRGFGR